MQWGKRAILAVAATTLLTGCATYSLHELRHTTPKGTEFQNALSKLYMGFAIQEEKDYDWFDSMYFADKGLTSAYGNDVEPEELGGWDIPEEVLPTMKKARDMLVRLLTPQFKRDNPQVAARALFYFDCWVEQQEENWQKEDIASCRDKLQNIFERMRVPVELAPMVDPEAPGPAVVPAPIAVPPAQDRVEKDTDETEATEAVQEPVEAKEAAESKADKSTVDERLAHMEPPPPEESETVESPFAPPAGVDTSSYMVFFDDHRTALPEAGKKIVDEIARTLEGTADYSVVIGASEHIEFADKRAHAVKSRLVEGGVNENAITISVAKAPDFMADSGEGDRAPIRHRVEIYLNQ